MKYILKIETTSYCNQKCIFCPQDKYYLKDKIMPMPLYNKIVDSIKSLNIKISNIHYGGMGEPLLDPYLFQRIPYGRKLTKHFTLTTNGQLLDANIECVNKFFSKVFFSFHGNTPEEYMKLTGNSFEVMKQKYLYAKEVLRDKLILVNHPEGKLRFLIEGKDPLESDIHPFHNFAEYWLSDKALNYGIDATMMGQKYCEFTLFVILGVDGSIRTCCNDWNNENKIISSYYPKCQRCNNQLNFNQTSRSRIGASFESLLKELSHRIGEDQN